MERKDVEKLIQKFLDGKITIDELIDELTVKPTISGLQVQIDGLRGIRKGFPETVFCLRKTPEQAKEAFLRVYETYGRALATKATLDHYKAISSKLPEAEFFPSSGIIKIGGETQKIGFVPVIGAGTSDYSVCEEAYLTLEFLGSSSEIVLDVGVAGIHRLEAVLEKLKRANAAIVVAGMEGALPSIVAGLSPVPVVGVPTSVGYGVSFGGISALLSMLNSCSEGLAVVNIDNGFGAAVFAHMVNIRVAGKGDNT